MDYRLATVEDIPQVSKLQERYHVSTIREEDKADGFVTTLFTEEQFKNIIEKEQGLTIAVDQGKVIAYAMAASWDYWSEWPFFQFMIEDLKNMNFHGEDLTVVNSYQYGPVCIDKPYRGKDVLSNLFEFSRRQMVKRFPILVTFINRINPRSLRAHTTKVPLEIIKPFEYNNNQYYALAYDMKKPLETATI